ncbi:mediator of DNA damage checkpoint protein 1-like [Anopheles marshallii]|uniref:mediator of DNA damage checkpoint protein 1-like n=1 Tax=Anopheles marshallii TaxID=1521116 RepID=UPI00237B6852|nr:mediator of DNA damage checkpoint protein 1-like [Anopheles marshallii]
MHLNIQGTKHPIRPGITLIGSVQNKRYNTILLQERSICPMHAGLRLDAATEKLQISDLCSFHGVTVDQKPIAPITWIDITTLSVLHVGDVLASVEVDHKSKADDVALLQDEDSTFDVIDCSLEETQPLQATRKNAHTAVSVLGTFGRRSSLLETTATVHDPPCPSSEGRRSSFLVPETQQIDGSMTCAKPAEIPILNVDHRQGSPDKDAEDDELCFIPETQQPEDELDCPSVIEPILPDVQQKEQVATEEEYFQITMENDDNSNDAMFNNKFIEQSQNLLQNPDISHSGAVVPKVSILLEGSVDSVSFQEHRNTTMEMSRIEWNDSKKDHEQSMIDQRLQQPKERGESLAKGSKISELIYDRSITPELNFEDDPPVEKEIHLKTGPDVGNRSIGNDQPSEQANHSSKTPDLCFDVEENEDDMLEISLNQEGCNKLKSHQSSFEKTRHESHMANVYDMETQAFGVDDPYELLTQPLHKLEVKTKSSAPKQQLEDPYELLTQPLLIHKPGASKHSEKSSFVKPMNSITSRKSEHSHEIDYANMPTQLFTPPELLYQPTRSYDDGSIVTEKGEINALVSRNESLRADSKRTSSFDKQTCAVAQSKRNGTPEIDYANLPTQQFTPPELLYQPEIVPEEDNKDPLPTSEIMIDDDDLLTQPLSPPKDHMDTPVLYRNDKNIASISVGCTAYDLDTQPLNSHMATNNGRSVKKNPVLKLVDIKTCHLSAPIDSNLIEIVSDVDDNMYDLGKLKLFENGTLPENEITQFSPKINSTTHLSIGQQPEGQQHMEPCMQISSSTSNKENSTKAVDEKIDDSFDTEDELCLASTIPIDALYPPKMNTECVEKADEEVQTSMFKIPLKTTDSLATPKAIRNRKLNNAEMTEFLTPEHPMLFLPKADCIRSVSEQMRDQNTTRALAGKGKPKYHFNDSSSSSGDDDDDDAINRQLFKKTNVSVVLEKELENVRKVVKLKQQALTDRGKVQPNKDDQEKMLAEQVKERYEGRSKRTVSTKVEQKEAEGVGKTQADSRKTSTRRRETKDTKKTLEPKSKKSSRAVRDKKIEHSKSTEAKQESKSSEAQSSTDRSQLSDHIPKRVSTRNRVETYKKRMLDESVDYLSESTNKRSTVQMSTRAGRKRKEESSTDREESCNSADVEMKRYKSGSRAAALASEVEVKERARRATSRTKKVVGTSSDLFEEQGKTSNLKSAVLGNDSATSSTGSDTSSVSTTRSNQPRLIFTKMSPEPYRKCIARAGGKIVDIPELATILVTDRIIRTYKFLCSVAKGIPIVGQSYLDALQNSDEKEKIDAWDHILSDPAKEKRYEFRLRDTLLKAKQRKLFQDYTVFVTSSTQPPPSELYLILSCAGAKISKHCSQPPKDTNKMFVISDPADSASWVKYREKFPSIEIVSAEGFMLSIMQHSIKFQKYRLM